MIENQEIEKRYTTLDGKKSLTLEQISGDFVNFLRGRKELEICIRDKKMLEMMARLFLIQKKYVNPGEQPTGISEGIFDNLVESVKKIQIPDSAMLSEEPISAFSKKEQKDMLAGAHKLKREEEKRAGQTYQDSGLE